MLKRTVVWNTVDRVERAAAVTAANFGRTCFRWAVLALGNKGLCSRREGEKVRRVAIFRSPCEVKGNGVKAMSMTDPIADMLTRIRNALRTRKSTVKMPRSKIKQGIAEVLVREGYINAYDVEEAGTQAFLNVKLKYGPNGETVISSLRRMSKPGRRLFSTTRELKPVLNGLGILILSTSKGILSDREAQSQNVGGEVLCEIY